MRVSESRVILRIFLFSGLGMGYTSRWTDGSDLELNKLTSPITTSECAFLKLSGSWEAGNCDDKKTVLCKRGM